MVVRYSVVGVSSRCGFGLNGYLPSSQTTSAEINWVRISKPPEVEIRRSPEPTEARNDATGGIASAPCIGVSPTTVAVVVGFVVAVRFCWRSNLAVTRRASGAY